jgi:N,N'-diacetyllegionaminate synthase
MPNCRNGGNDSMDRVFIVAEAGVNHNGSLELAKELVDIAANAGADAIKFQTWKTELLISRSIAQADYQFKNTGLLETQFEMAKRLELPHSDFLRLREYCLQRGIIFMSTPDDVGSAIFLRNLQDIFKVGSGSVTDLHLLKYIGSLNKKVILSTGMASMVEIRDALEVLQSSGTSLNKITLLHCTTEYPAPKNEVNLRAMHHLREVFGTAIGYSDHTLGIEIAIAAVALGARVIEKHFTSDVNLPGPDHKASLNPVELLSMVRSIREIELALGDGVKRMTPSERKNVHLVRKCIVANGSISKGAIFTDENLTTLRAGLGISPMNWSKIIGKFAARDYQDQEIIDS